MKSQMGRTAGYRRCEVCALVAAVPPRAADARLECRRCHATLHERKPRALARTAAFVLAGFVFYIPANLYPVMTIELLGRPDPNTIFSGVRELFQSGMWEIGLLVFAASILVPLMKLVGLTYLLVCVRFGWMPGGRSAVRVRRERTILFRMIEFVGRWSMLDMFLLSMLVALVRFGAVATIVPGIGATSFAMVVVTTMFAAASFDPRLLWDASEDFE
ncbi:MAG: paraquat-inducible protein A [Deltaproteobacteria bacterium]